MKEQTEKTVCYSANGAGAHSKGIGRYSAQQGPAGLLIQLHNQSLR